MHASQMTWLGERPAPDSDVTERVTIDGESDLLRVRSTLRSYAGQVGMGLTATTKLVTAGSELARNILLYAGCGAVSIALVGAPDAAGIRAVFADSGPGIADLDEAMQDGFSTAGSLGLGLPGSRRLVDEFAIESRPGEGTRVVITQWVR